MNELEFSPVRLRFYGRLYAGGNVVFHAHYCQTGGGGEQLVFPRVYNGNRTCPKEIVIIIINNDACE